MTPQATLGVIDYEVPGLAEAMRAAGRAITPMADLSRGVVGVRGRTLIVNLPGSPKGALESLAAIEPVLDHALETLAGPFDHGARRALSVTLFEPFEHVPAYPLVFPIFWGAFALFAHRHRASAAGVHGRPRGRRRRSPAPSSAAAPGASSATPSSSRRCSAGRGPGVIHYVVFLGSTILLIGNINIVTGGLLQAVLVVAARRRRSGRSWSGSRT